MPLDDFSRILGSLPRRATLFGAPEGHDAATLGACCATAKPGRGCMSAATTGGWRGSRRRSNSSIPGLAC